VADREVVFHVTIPAGTPAAAPLITPVAWAPGHVRKIHVTIPDGHAGLTGYAIGYAGQQTIPDGAGTFIVSNDEKIEHDIAVPYVGSQWFVSGYNTDVHDHTFHIRAEIDEISKGEPAPVLPANVTPDTVETPGTGTILPIGEPPDTSEDDTAAEQIADSA
jgi:hypothetical protein